MKTYSFNVLLVLFFLLCFPSFLKSQNVIIVVIDGARYSETFGSDSTYIPHLYNDMKPLGTLFSDYSINYPSGFTETCPGHSAIESGTWQPIENDGTERPTNPTIFEYLRKENGNPQSDCYVVTGKSKLDILSYSTYSGFGSDYGGTWVGDDDRKDSLTYLKAITVMQSYHPKLLVVSFSQVDDVAHDGNWENYLSAITNADTYVYQLWQHIKAGDYGYNTDNTTVFVTNDHGRHDDAHGGFTSHGDGCAGCVKIMLLALGRNVTANQVLDTAVYQTDIAPTVGLLLGFQTPLATGSSLLGPLNSISLTSPNGGENWIIGNSYNITWSSSNITNVKIDYTTNSGSNWINIISSTSASAGSYNWTVPNTPSSQYMVRISDAANDSVYAESQEVFSIKFSTLLLVSPADSSNNVSLMPTLSWSEVSGADKYRLEVNTKDDFTGAIIFDQDTVSQISIQISGLSDNTTFYWRVTALNDSGNTGDASSIFTFTTGQSKLISVQNGAKSVSITPTLSWYKTAGAISYRLEVNTTPEFAGTVVYDNSLITDTSQSLGGLNYNTTYYWRVTANSNSLSKEMTSEVFYFTTKLSSTILISPADNSTDVGLMPTLSWSEVNGADKYRLEVNTKDDFTGTAIFDQDTVSQTTKQISGLSDNTTYYWRVTALNDSGNTGDASSISSFVTATATEIEVIRTTIPKNYVLFQNYPNPFNPKTIIRFAIPAESKVKITVHDILGQELITLLNSYKSAGYHEIAFNAFNYASGTYFYRIVAASTDGKNSFVDTKKIILMK